MVYQAAISYHYAGNGGQSELAASKIYLTSSYLSNNCNGTRPWPNCPVTGRCLYKKSVRKPVGSQKNSLSEVDYAISFSPNSQNL